MGPGLSYSPDVGEVDMQELPQMKLQAFTTLLDMLEPGMSVTISEDQAEEIFGRELSDLDRDCAITAVGIDHACDWGRKDGQQTFKKIDQTGVATYGLSQQSEVH
jgi:hypothetical protein